jgi:uncharacterized protein YndB with AHSA1/START domain
MSDVEHRILRMERLIAAPPDILFALWIEPAELVKWWAPDGLVAEVDTLDVRPDGRWRTILRRPDGSGLAASGVYRIVEPPHRLAFTWAWEDASGARGHETEVSVSFDPAPGGTRLVLVQQSFENRQARDNHNHGWAASFDRIGAIVGGRGVTS